MSDFLNNPTPLYESHVELLGYDCTSEDESKVKELLASLTGEEHSLHLEWVTYGVEGVMVNADELVTQFTDRRRADTLTDVEQASVVADLESRLAWFRFLDSAEEVALLTYAEPDDEIGAGDVSNLEWEIIKGGSQDYALHKMLEAGIAGLENWKRWVLGETKLKHALGGSGRGGVLDRMDRALSENSPEELERKGREFVENVYEILNLLAPGLKQVKDFTESMGIDWDELITSGH